MNALTPTQSVSDALRHTAMVAEVTVTALGLSRVDKQASTKAEQDHAATAGSARVVVRRLAGAEDLAREIMSLQNEAQGNLRSNSMAWGAGGGRRLLPNANFLRWNARHEEINATFEAKVKEFVDGADSFIAQARQNAGTFNVDVPTKDEIASAYSMRKLMEPIPDGSQFGQQFGSVTGDVVDQVSANLRREFERNIEAAAREAQQDALRKVQPPLQALIDRMDAYDKREREYANGVNPGREGIFRDTVIENVQDLAEVFSGMNVLNDPAIGEIVRSLSDYQRIDAGMLRKHQQVRDFAKNRAREIIAKIDPLLSL